jgi:glycosyltransferase involved in cell wall biosynthesis
MAEELLERDSWQAQMIGRIGRFLRDALIRRAHATIAMSTEMAQYLSARTELPRSRILSLPSLVALSSRHSAGCESALRPLEEALRAHGPARRWLAYIGTLSLARKPTFLIDALLAARSQGLNVGLLILGVSNNPRDREQLHAYTRERQAEDFVILWPPVPEPCVTLALRNVEIGLSPFPPNTTMRFNSPLKLLEYMKAGLPVVGTAIPDQASVIESSGSGLLAEHTPSAFAAAIRQLLADPDDRRESRARHALHWIQQNRSLEVGAEVLASAFSAE